MKTNELRIRNLLLDDRGVITKVYSLNDDEINNDDLTVHYKPIPLTPELLEKCGFKKYDGYGYKVAQGYIIKHANGYFYHYHDLRIRVDYLHQLQNLVFALTGKEIEINL